MGDTIQVIKDPAAASVMLHPLRIRILEKLQQPASPAALSRVLDIPRQHLNYHVRELEAAGLVELVEEKRRGSATERFYRATARTYVIAPESMGGLRADPSAIQDRFSSEYVIALGSRLIGDVVELMGSSKPVATFALETEISFGSEAEKAQFARELMTSISRLSAAYNRPGGEKVRVVVAVHPEVS